MTARCQPIRVFILTATRVSRQPIRSYPEDYSSESPLKDKDSLRMYARSRPIRVFTRTTTRVS